MLKRSSLLALGLTLLWAAVPAAQVIDVVTSTTDLKSITDAVGGDKVRSTSIARGNQNIHFVDVLPSYMLKIKKARLYVKIGMGLDQWADPLIDGSRNANLMILDCSRDIEKLDVPSSAVDASMGDVHPYGNPHYWLDPRNGKVMARTIFDALCRLSPQDAPYFAERLKTFEMLMDQKMEVWKKLFEPYHGTKIVVYHDDWRYFAGAFGLNVVGFVEPKPGLEPTPSHLFHVANLIRNEHVRLIGYQPYFSEQAPQSLADQTGARALVLATSVGCVPGVYTYLDIFEYNLSRIIAVLNEGG